MEAGMGSFGSFLGGLVVGAAIGFTIVAFTTPKAGDQTRSDLKEYWQNALNTGKRVAQQREDELWAEFNTRVTSPGPSSV
jgi:gas vesicle protein